MEKRHECKVARRPPRARSPRSHPTVWIENASIGTPVRRVPIYGPGNNHDTSALGERLVQKGRTVTGDFAPTNRKWRAETKDFAADSMEIGNAVNLNGRSE